MLREKSIELDNLPKHHDNKKRDGAPDRMSVVAMKPVKATPRFRRELKKAPLELFLPRVNLEHALPSITTEFQELTDDHSKPDTAAIADNDVKNPMIPPAFLKSGFFQSKTS